MGLSGEKSAGGFPAHRQGTLYRAASRSTFVFTEADGKLFGASAGEYQRAFCTCVTGHDSQSFFLICKISNVLRGKKDISCAQQLQEMCRQGEKLWVDINKSLAILLKTLDAGTARSLNDRIEQAQKRSV